MKPPGKWTKSHCPGAFLLWKNVTMLTNIGIKNIINYKNRR